MSRVAWTLTDNEQATPVVYHFEVNPKTDQGSFAVQKGIHYGVSAGPGGATVVHEGPDDAMKVSYMGILLSESQYNDMVTWMNKEYPVTLTDDLGQASLVYLESLEYSRAPKRHRQFRHEYTLTAFVLERL